MLSYRLNIYTVIVQIQKQEESQNSFRQCILRAPRSLGKYNITYQSDTQPVNYKTCAIIYSSGHSFYKF